VDTIETYTWKSNVIIRIGEKQTEEPGSILSVENATFFEYLKREYRQSTFWTFSMPDLLMSSTSILLTILMLVQCLFVMKNKKKARKLEKQYLRQSIARVKKNQQKVTSTENTQTCEPLVEVNRRYRKAFRKRTRFDLRRPKEDKPTVADLPLYLLESDLSLDTEPEEKMKKYNN